MKFWIFLQIFEPALIVSRLITYRDLAAILLSVVHITQEKGPRMGNRDCDGVAEKWLKLLNGV